MDRNWLELSYQLHAPATLLPEKEPPNPLDKKLGKPHSRSGRRGEEKILEPNGTRTPKSRSSSP
jgi:hypothetical protein